MRTLLSRSLRRGAAWLLVPAAVLWPAAAVASICVHTTAKVRKIQGRAVYEGKQGKEPLEGVKVRLQSDQRPPRVLAEAVTGSDGRFSFEGLPRGSYWLAADHATLSDITTRVVVPRAWPWRGGAHREILLVFGFDPDQACRGSWVEVVAAPR